MATEQTAPGPVSLDRGVRGALVRYRVMAYVVGVAHGTLYAIFFLATLDLAVRARWRPLSALLVVVAGTIPFLSFVAERQVTGRMRAGRRV